MENLEKIRGLFLEGKTIRDIGREIKYNDHVAKGILMGMGLIPFL